MSSYRVASSDNSEISTARQHNFSVSFTFPSSIVVLWTVDYRHGFPEDSETLGLLVPKSQLRCKAEGRQETKARTSCKLREKL